LKAIVIVIVIDSSGGNVLCNFIVIEYQLQFIDQSSYFLSVVILHLNNVACSKEILKILFFLK